MLDEKDLDMLEAGLTRGWSNERIAKALDIGLSTLKRNFGPLLRMRDQMPDRLHLALFAATARKALEAGDMGAVRQLRIMMAEDATADAEARLAKVQKAPKPQPLGKKEIGEQQAADAEESLFAEIEEEAKGVFRH